MMSQPRKFRESYVKGCILIGLLILIAIVWIRGVNAQSPALKVLTTGVDDKKYPQVTAFLSVVDSEGVPVVGLNETNFQILGPSGSVAGQPVQVESYLVQNLDLVLALDLSFDYQDDFEQIKSAALAFVEGLQPGDEVQLIVFHDEVKLIWPSSDAAQAELKAVIEQLQFKSGYTRFYEAADFARQRLTEKRSRPADAKPAIVMLTNIGSNPNLGEANAAEREAAFREKVITSPIPIYVMSFEPRARIDDLRTLTDQTGGQSLNLPQAKDLIKPAQWLNVVLRQGYKVTFQSGFPAKDDRQSVQIQVKAAKQSTGTAEVIFRTRPQAVDLEISGLKSGQIVTGSLEIAHQVMAAAPAISVSYRLDGKPLFREPITERDFRFTRDRSQLADGHHRLDIIAVDSVGNRTDPPVVTIAFEIPARPRIVLPHSSVAFGDDFYVEIVSAEIPYPAVVFLLDDRIVEPEQIFSKPLRYRFRRDSGSYPAQPGLHRITVQTYDQYGQLAADSVEVQFNPPAGPPDRLGPWQVVILVLLDLIAFYLMALLWGRARQYQHQFGTCMLTLVNQGNMETAYALSAGATDAASPMVFRFETFSDGSVVEQHRYQPADDAKPDMDEDRVGQDPAEDSPAVRSASNVGSSAGQAAKGLKRITALLTKQLAWLSKLPVVGSIFRGPAAKFAQKQARFGQQVRLPLRAVNQVQLLRPAGANGNGQPGPDETIPTRAEPNLEDSDRDQPTVATGQFSQRTRDGQASPSPWRPAAFIETRLLMVSQAQTLQLYLKPAQRPTKTESYSFFVLSRPLGLDHQAEQSWQRQTDGQMTFRAYPWIYRFMPFWMSGLMVCLALVHVAYALYYLTNIL